MDMEELSRKLAQGLDSLRKTSYCEKKYKGPRTNVIL